MIRYALACDDGHEFESWFPSSAGFEAQQARGLVTCPVCDSTAVGKQIMRPSVSRSDKAGAVARRAAAEAPAEAPGEAPPVPAPPPLPAPMALLAEKEREIRAMLKAVREHVVKTAENVGPRFVDEARRMHYGEIDHRSIYGEASRTEAKELIEEGVEIHPLPIIAEDRN